MPLDIGRIREARLSNQIHYFPVVDSTMIEAARLVSENAPHGTVVLADEQTAGIGRFGRHWISDAEAGIYCSIILRLPVPPRHLPVVTLLLGLAVRDAIERVANLTCDLRWPNDVLVNECKAAGILAQLQDGCIIAGIGINVNHAELPSGLRTPATSLRIALGREQPREPLIIALLDTLDDCCALLVKQGPAAICQAFTAGSSYALHRRVVFETDQGPGRGTTMGVDENGFLKIRDHSGMMQTLYTGGVRPDLP